MRRTPLDEIGPPGDDAGLRPSEQLVGAEGDEVGAVGERLHRRGLAGEPRRRRPVQPGHGRVEEPAADVGDDGDDPA